MRLENSRLQTFGESVIPANTRLAGWAALVQGLSLKAPVRNPSCVSSQHVKGSRRHTEPWNMFDKRYWPGDDVEDHLGFALKHETMDLLILKRVFKAVGENLVAGLVRITPTGVTARRLWFFYEMLAGRNLDLP